MAGGQGRRPGLFSHKAPMPYDWIPLAEDRMVAVLPPGHPLAGPGVLSLAQCAQEDFIMPPWAGTTMFWACWRPTVWSRKLPLPPWTQSQPWP